MNNDFSALKAGRIRQTDTNSLIRLMDIASAILRDSTLQHDRVRADKAIRKINEELRKRTGEEPSRL